MNFSPTHKIKFGVILLFTVFVFAGCSPQKAALLSDQNSQVTSPAPSPAPSAEEIRKAIDEGAAAREKGDYQTGETKLAFAFNGAIAANDKATSIEAGNNLSIQYRLSAGRANRDGQDQLARGYSDKSLAVYDKLWSVGWFDDSDPNLARNWAHALLYAGKLDQAVPALIHSRDIQTTPSAVGDEQNHLAAAYLAQGKSAEAKDLFTKGIGSIEKNAGSKIWLTFGLMTRATWEGQNNQEAAAVKTVEQALKIATDNNLSVRQEELTFMSKQPAKEFNVLQIVGTPNN